MYVADRDVFVVSVKPKALSLIAYRTQPTNRRRVHSHHLYTTHTPIVETAHCSTPIVVGSFVVVVVSILIMKATQAHSSIVIRNGVLDRNSVAVIDAEPTPAVPLHQ